MNPRPAEPEPLGGTVRVAAMNTLNFFVTADYPTGNPSDNKCGPANNVECRGWDSDQATEFTRQRDKLLTALSGLDAEEGIAQWYKPYKEFTVALNCVGVCLYPALFNIPSVKQSLDAYSAITGRKIDVKHYLMIGERTVCMQRAFNAREGFARKDDTLPNRILNEPIKGGKYDGQRIVSLDAMLDDYYRESGFDQKTGWPTRDTLKALGLQDVAAELYPA